MRLVYQYEWWVPLSAFLGGLVVTPIGWSLRERSARFGWGLVIAGPIAAVVLAPSLFRDRAAVGAEGFHIRTGVWGLTTVQDVQFGDLKQIRVSSSTSFTRTGRRTNYYLNCDKRNGESVKVPINSGVTEAAADAILVNASAHGVPLEDKTGGH